MKQSLLSIAMILVTTLGWSQHQVGHTTITFNDPGRTGGFGSGGGSGRQIQSEIYYPTAAAGEDVPLASGTFPVIVFGHGFAMSWDAYQNIWEELVPMGYIMVFPRTEGSLIPAPVHEDFGLDLVVCVDRMQMENADATSLFYNHVDPKAAIMGHSMGGGATFLAAATSPNIETIVGLAPAETTPSAITAAASVQVPTLILSGSEDGVTPPVDHHIPMYNAVTTCKYFVSITGGGHCYFANSNFNCDFGETTSSTGISINRPDQQAVMNDYITKWFDFKLKGDCSAFSAFDNLLGTDSRVTTQQSCSGTTPSISANGPVDLCDGETVDLDAGQSVIWSEGTVASTLTVGQSGTYYASDPNTCQSSNSITVNVAAPVNVSVTQNGNTLTAGASSATYQWVDCDANFAVIGGETGQSYTTTNNGNYAVVVSESGCSDTSSCFNIAGTIGLDEPNSKNRITVFPNPAQGSFMVNLSQGDGRFHIRLLSMDGKVIKDQRYLDADSALVETGSLQGTFILEVRTETTRFTGLLVLN